MKKIIATVLSLLMLLPVLAACADEVPDVAEGSNTVSDSESKPSDEDQTNDKNDEEKEPPEFTASDLQIDMSAFAESYELYKVTDFNTFGAGILSSREGVFELVDKNDRTAVKISRAEDGKAYQSGKWMFNEAQDWRGCDGLVCYVDFSEANTDTFHGITLSFFVDMDGDPMQIGTDATVKAYSSLDGKGWVERGLHESDSAEKHAALHKNYVGYVYVPFDQLVGYEDISLEKITGVGIEVCRVTSGHAVVSDVTLVSLSGKYDTPTTVEDIIPGSPQSLDMSKLVANKEISQVTDFNGVGAGKIENVASNTVIGRNENNCITLVRDAGNWYQAFDWVFDQKQSFAGMAGILIKVDYTAANTNSTNGGHGITVGIRTEQGSETVFNDPTLGGFAYNMEKGAWQRMEPCAKHSQILVVNPGVYNRYAGYIYIPVSAFGADGIEGLDSVTALTVYSGANTSGTAVLEGIWLVKGTELVPEEEKEEVIERDNDGTPVIPETVTSPVDMTGVVSGSTVAQVTDFGTVGAGSITNTDGDISLVDNKISVVRSGDWYCGFDWIFTNAQNWSGAAGLMIKVDFSGANTDSSKGFHGIGLSLYTKAMGDEGSAALDPAKGGYLYIPANSTWTVMDVSSQDAKYLDGGKRYSGYIFVPFSSITDLSGLEHVTGFNLLVGAITSQTAYVESVYLVSGTVEVIDPVAKFFEDSKKDHYNDVLENVVINAIGDSYFKGNGLDMSYVWPQLLATKYDTLLNNYGMNGSTVTNYITTKNPMCIRYTNMSTAANIVLIEGGRNDYNNGVPIGSVDSYDTTTFMGALNTIVKGVKESNPKAMIVLITNWKFNGENSAGLTYADYANAMVTVAAAQGVYCINASDPEVVGVDMTDADFRAQYSMTPTDVSHLNLYGMMYVMPKFEKMIAAYYEEFIEENGSADISSEVLDVEWSKGYVGSSTNTSWAGKVNTGANAYSYSDVIIIEKAGTTITFTDSESGFASGSAYVISFWVKDDNGEWVIDESATHYAGNSGNGSDVETKIGSSVTYTYTTTEDNECIRLCYRSEQTATNTPTFLTVTLVITNS